MRRGHVTANGRQALEPAPIALSPRLAPGTCPKCGRHFGRLMRGHALGCGALPTVSPPSSPAPHFPLSELLAPKPLIGPQPDLAALAPAAPIAASPVLPRLLHGEQASAGGRRRAPEGSVAKRQAAAVARMKAQAGIAP